MLEQALILAGGLGTRFRAVRDDIPKPLAPVGGKPVLEHQISSMAQAGVRRAVLCVGYMHEAIERHFGDGQSLGLELVYSRESQPLGTAGAVGNAREHLAQAPFAVLNGDTLMPELNYRELGRWYANHSCAIGMVITPPPDAGAYGVLELSADADKVIGFREKAGLGADFASARISAGVYIFDPDIFEFIPRGQPRSMEDDVFPQALQQGWTIGAFAHSGFFGDMGTPEGYARTNEFFNKASA